MATISKTNGLVGGTLASDIHHRLREDIVSCVLEPGQRLRFEQLKEIYGASYSTLREALSSLVAEQLVVAEGQRGFRVAPISAADLLDLTDARVLLEREAVRRAIERADATSRAQIMSAFHRLDRVEAGLHDQHRITGEWDTAHFDFHEALVAAAGSPTLNTLRHALFDRARRYRRLSALVRPAPRAKRAEHREMMEVMLSGDVAAAQDLFERHIREIAQNVLTNGLESLSDAEDPARTAPSGGDGHRSSGIA